MKVIKSEDNLVVFDNGLEIIGVGDRDCCAYNYLDFEQFPVGTELPDMGVEQFCESMTLKYDGFSIKDIEGTPKWAEWEVVEQDAKQLMQEFKRLFPNE